MADLSKIKLNGTTYNFKDAAARQAIGDMTSFNVAIISTFPTGNNIDTHTIYFKSKTGESGDVYDEYMYINNNWELIGTTAVDLSDYLQTTDIASWAKAASKPTYTASEVGAAASDHTHGSITNAGAITTNTALANGDRLVFSDNSDSNLLKRASITFGTSTTQYLANNGNWQNVPSTTVTQTLTSGTAIGSVNGTTLYAPAQTTVSISNTLSSGTLIATINGTNIYAPSYTNGDELAYGGN